LIAIISVKVISFLYGMATAISVVNGRMVVLNATMRKNLIFMAATGVVFGIQKIIDALGLFGDEVEDNTTKQNAYNDSLREFDRQLRDQKASIADAMKTDKIEEFTTATDQMTLSMALFDEQLNQQKQSLASIDEEYLKIIEHLGLLNDAQIKVLNGFDAQKQASRDAHRTEAQTAEEAAQKNIEAFKNSEFEKINTKKVTDKQLRQMGRHTLREGARINKELFRLNQALNIGEAIMNTAKGVTAALPNIPLALAIGAFGAIQVATIASQQPPAQFGGIRQAGSPFLVGEKGAELFTPATAGTVTPAHQMPSGSTVVNFNINTVSAKGFNELLNNSRGMITNMINQAVNEKGKANLI
jgi:hypothetical protein